jgi:cytosine deaminase
MHALSGRWAANLSKSRPHPTTPFSSAALDVEVRHATVTIVRSGVDMSGGREHATTTLAPDGQPHEPADSPGVSLVTRWAGPQRLESIATRNCVVVERTDYEMAADGQSLIATISRLDPAGATFEERFVFDRVPPIDAFMDTAVAEAEAGLGEGGIPIGSVLVHRNEIIGRGHNRRVQRLSAILHGEMDALERAGRLPASVYTESVLYTTLSPCAMCSGAILLYGIPRVLVGENVTFLGEEALLRSRGVRVDVVQDARCVAMMREFIARHPTLWNEDIGV